MLHEGDLLDDALGSHELAEEGGAERPDAPAHRSVGDHCLASAPAPLDDSAGDVFVQRDMLRGEDVSCGGRQVVVALVQHRADEQVDAQRHRLHKDVLKE